MGSKPGRRAFLLAAGLVLVGCSPAARRGTKDAGPRVTAKGTASLPSATASRLSPSPTSQPATADVDAVIARMNGRRPTAWGMDLSGILTRGSADAITLTFDACGGPGGSGIDRQLIDLLTSRGVKATLFLNMRWIKANTSYAKELAANPLFELGNHGSRHCPISVTGRAAYGIPGTANVSEACHEIADNHAYMASELGKAPRLFRAGTAHYDDVGVACCREFGETPVGFAINGDAGATYTASQVVTEAGKARAGDIVISHMNQPAGQTFEGYSQLIPRWLDAGVSFAHLPA